MDEAVGGCAKNTIEAADGVNAGAIH
jgi:hypothetical protein